MRIKENDWHKPNNSVLSFTHSLFFPFNFCRWLTNTVLWQHQVTFPPSFPNLVISYDALKFQRSWIKPIFYALNYAPCMTSMLLHCCPELPTCSKDTKFIWLGDRKIIDSSKQEVIRNDSRSKVHYGFLTQVIELSAWLVWAIMKINFLLPI